MYIAPTFKLMIIIHFDVVNSMRNATLQFIMFGFTRAHTQTHIQMALGMVWLGVASDRVPQ